MIKDLFIGMPWYLYLLLILCLGLIVASWFVPPMGVIHPSVLQAIAEILGFAWLYYTMANVPVFIEKGAKIKASWKDASIEIGRKKNEVQLTAEQPEEETENE